LVHILDGLNILLLEDEFLIAMDVEQLCRDNGAEDVHVVRSLDDIDIAKAMEFDAAIVDVMLGGQSTLELAASLKDAGTPFVFASGYTDNEELAAKFPGVALIGKPYDDKDLIEALARACAARAASSGGA
jgi:CheY-like chemotaxis protein